MPFFFLKLENLNRVKRFLMEDLLEKQAKSNHDTVPNDCHELKEIFKIVC